MAIKTNPEICNFNTIFIFYNTSILVKEHTLDLPDKETLQGLISEKKITSWIFEDTYNYVSCFLENDIDLPTTYELIPLVTIFSYYDSKAQLAARARSLVLWKQHMNYCSTCGGELLDSNDETAVDCKRCNIRRYPSFSPAIIVLIRKGNQVLLAKHAQRAQSVYTCLAGYLEQGETLEDCVKREVFEEVALKVTNVRYIKSQSWPFPNQIMLGFVCDWESGDIQIDKNELEEANWYYRDSFPDIPRKGTIAHYLITSELG